VKEIKMTKDGVDKTISIDELRKHDTAESPWFVVNGEVYDGTAFLEGHPGGAQSIISAAGLDASDEFMAIRKYSYLWTSNQVPANTSTDSETAKAMMPEYHIGSLDEASRKVLAEGEPINESTEPRSVFLDPRIWNKTLLHAKTPVSPDTRIFTFKLDHDEQTLGLPTGQHLMIRLRDPVTREAIIRSYTPISQTTKKGFVDVLIKIYADSHEKVGGKMTKALDAIPVGHWVDFKGPIGKFEYLGRGLCAVNGKQRSVSKFYMICGGSGITPIFQVLRAVMQDKEDATHCTVLNGNRLVDDILCREDLDVFAQDNKEKCKLLYTLTQGPEDWDGLRGRIGPSLLQEHCKKEGDGESLVLICGPEALEKSTHKALNEQGWKDEDLMFF
jgi:nitrate reductase (NAD(P)H)